MILPSELPSRTSTPQQRPSTVGTASDKRHVSGSLKFVENDKKRIQTLEAAEKWKEQFADEKRWKPLLKRIQDFSSEGDMRVPSVPRPGQIDEGASQSSRKYAATPVSLAVRQLRPAAATALTVITRPRQRWDIVSHGPVSPLSPTPTGNAFARGGFWASLSPSTETFDPTSASTAVQREPWSPIVPNDAAHREVHDAVKSEARNIALRICANRLLPRSKARKNGLVHPSLLKPQDHLYAARALVTKKRKAVDTASYSPDPTLPATLADSAAADAIVIAQLNIPDIFALLDNAAWLHMDVGTQHISTVLDSQRDMLRASREVRNGTVLHLSDAMIQLAWATRILEDAEEVVAREQEDSVSGDADEDAGYEYGNFLRSLRDLGTLGETEITLVETDGDAGGEDGRDSGGSERGDGGSVQVKTDEAPGSEERHCSAKATLQPKAAAQFNCTPAPQDTESFDSDATISLSCNDGVCELQTQGLDASTITLTTSLEQGGKENEKEGRVVNEQEGSNEAFEDKEISTPSPISPIDKEFRHKAPSLTDLTVWAEELRRMEGFGAELLGKADGIEIDMGGEDAAHGLLSSPQEISETSATGGVDEEKEANDKQRIETAQEAEAQRPAAQLHSAQPDCQGPRPLPTQPQGQTQTHPTSDAPTGPQPRQQPHLTSSIPLPSPSRTSPQRARVVEEDRSNPSTPTRLRPTTAMAAITTAATCSTASTPTRKSIAALTSTHLSPRKTRTHVSPAPISALPPLPPLRPRSAERGMAVRAVSE